MSVKGVLKENRLVYTIKQNKLLQAILGYTLISVISVLIGYMITEIIIGGQTSISYAKLIGGSFAFGGIILIMMGVVMFDTILVLISLAELIIGIIFLT